MLLRRRLKINLLYPDTMLDLSPSREATSNIESIIQDQLHFLKPVQDCWQPADFLPDLSSEDWREKVNDLKKEALGLSDEMLVVLVGNLVTEEALPSYQTWLNRTDGLHDETGASLNPWALWIRRWTAEENRHGEVLNKYLYLSGRANMRSVEATTQYLIQNGFDLKSEKDPYKSLIYASFQERATKISHANIGRLAEKSGDSTLGKICAAIAGDEARHEEAYKRIMAKIFEIDQSKALLAFYKMMKQKIVMPASLMSDGTSSNLFSQFAIVAQRTGVYTTHDYADVISHLVQYWGISTLRFLSGEESKAQDYLCGLADHYLAKADQIKEVIAHQPKEPFQWIFGRSA